MRELADVARIRRFIHALGAAADREGRCYLTGGATAVLLGWRRSTIDVDIKLVPAADALLRAIQRLKNELRVNVELASPADFIPVPSGWEDRSIFETRVERLSFYHFDPYAQALAKLERNHTQDRGDVEAMLERSLIEPAQALAYFDQIGPELYRFPAIDARSFRDRVQAVMASG